MGVVFESATKRQTRKCEIPMPNPPSTSSFFLPIRSMRYIPGNVDKTLTKEFTMTKMEDVEVLPNPIFENKSPA